MKTIITVCLSGIDFTVEDDAYRRLEDYLEEFKRKSGEDIQLKELMEDVEMRIADIFTEYLAASHQEAVNIRMVEDMMNRIGFPDGSTPHFHSCDKGGANGKGKATKKLYRDPDDKKIAGVCGGLAAYLDTDVTLIRAIALIALICGSAGGWIYIVFWIVSPVAKTAAQKCEMRGLEANAENMRKYR